MPDRPAPTRRARSAAVAAVIATVIVLASAGEVSATVFDSGALSADFGAAQAAAVPPGFSDSAVFSGLTHPTAVRFAPDGRVFVAEKGGRVKVFDSMTDPTATTWADLTAKVHDFWDRGLLALALDPGFPARPYVYVLYTYDKAPNSPQVPRWGDDCPSPPGPTADGCVVGGRLSRLTAGGGEDVLIEDFCQQYPSHTVGSLAFGPDGALYVSAGDGASFNWPDYGQEGDPPNPCGDPPSEGGALRSQDVRTPGDPTGLSGAILRVDPDTGAALPDNPNASSPDPNARRIVAHGFRNPFRITIRPGTSEVWAGDVGWYVAEEINRIPNPTGAVRNHGWPCFEGGNRQPQYDALELDLCESLPTGGVAAPYYAYSHGSPVVAGEPCANGGSSISGLAFYTGGSFGPEYEDALFFSDYSRRCIWVIFEGANGLPDPATRQVFATPSEGPVELQIGPDGDLYYVDLIGGAIRRIRGPYSDEAPTAVAEATPDSGAVPLEVSFDGRDSSDPDGDALSYAWDLDGDGQLDDSTAAAPTWTYTTPGVVSVRLRVTDSGGLTDTTMVTVTAGTPPDVTIATPVTGATWRVGDTIALSGSATDWHGQALPPTALEWQIDLEHCTGAGGGCHTHVVQNFSGASGSLVAPEHEYPSHLELRLTATDGDGLTRTVTRRLDPKTVPITVRSEPPGARLSLGIETAAAPFTGEVIQGARTVITADTPVILGGVRYDFAGWSDGGTRTHEIVAGASPATYTARYDGPPLKPQPQPLPKPQPPDDTPAPPPDGGDPQPAGPVGAWGFEEARGRAAADSSGHGHTGTVSGASRTRGRHGRGLRFDGADDWVTIPDAAALDFTRALTLEAWVRPAGRGSPWQAVVVKERGRARAYGLYAASGRKRQPGGRVFTDRDRGVRGPSALPRERWSHLAMTWDGETVRLYVNGRQVATGPLRGRAKTSRRPLRIGGNAIRAEWFRGRIDDVRVYDRALTAAEIAADRDTPVG